MLRYLCDDAPREGLFDGFNSELYVGLTLPFFEAGWWLSEDICDKGGPQNLAAGECSVNRHGITLKGVLSRHQILSRAFHCLPICAFSPNNHSCFSESIVFLCDEETM